MRFTTLRESAFHAYENGYEGKREHIDEYIAQLVHVRLLGGSLLLLCSHLGHVVFRCWMRWCVVEKFVMSVVISLRRFYEGLTQRILSILMS